MPAFTKVLETKNLQGKFTVYVGRINCSSSSTIEIGTDRVRYIKEALSYQRCEAFIVGIWLDAVLVSGRATRCPER